MDTNEIISQLEDCKLIEIDWDSKPDLSELHNAVINGELGKDYLPEGVYWHGKFSEIRFFVDYNSLEEYAIEGYADYISYENDAIDIEYAIENNLMNFDKEDAYATLVEKEKEYWLNEESDAILEQFPQLKEEYEKRVEALEDAKENSDQLPLYLQTILDVFDQTTFLDNILEGIFYDEDITEQILVIKNIWKQSEGFNGLSEEDEEESKVKAKEILRLLLSDSKSQKQIGFNLLEFYANPLILYPLRQKKYRNLERIIKKKISQFSLVAIEVIPVLKKDTCMRYRVAQYLEADISEYLTSVQLEGAEKLQELETYVEYFLTDSMYYMLENEISDSDFLGGATSVWEYAVNMGLEEEEWIINIFGGIDYEDYARTMIEENPQNLGYAVFSSDGEVHQCGNLWYFYL